MRKWLLFLGLAVGGLFLSACSVLTSKAGLQVITDGVPTSIYLNGKYQDKTPYINKEVKPGEYTLEIRPENAQLAPYQTKISLKKGLLTVVNWKPGDRPETSGGVIYEMEPLRNRKASELSITTVPDGAIIHVDAEAKGFAPVLMEQISPGPHEFEVSLPSYQTQKNMINVLQGHRMNVTVKLAKQTFVPTETSPNSELASPSAQLASPSASPAVRPSTSPKVSPSPKATPKASPTSTLPRPKVRIKSTGFFNNGEEVLRVRDKASASGGEVGMAPVGSEYAYLDETTSGWHKIDFNGEEGWVSGQYAELLK